jgi:hypothetical protein
MGSYCSVLNDTQGTMYCKYGPNLEFASVILAVIGEVSEFIPIVGLGISIVAWAGEAVIQIVHLNEADKMHKLKGNIDEWFRNQGYSARSPGSEYVSEKLSLSLNVAAHCAMLTDVGGGKLELRIGDMSCWSGPTDGEKYQYKLSVSMLDTPPWAHEVKAFSGLPLGEDHAPDQYRQWSCRWPG